MRGLICNTLKQLYYGEEHFEEDEISMLRPDAQVENVETDRRPTFLCERNEADGRLIEREHEVLALTQARDTLYKRIDELEGRLRKFDRTRGKNGKYIKGHETRSAK